MRAMRQSLPPPLTPLSPLLETLSMNKCRENYVYCLTPYSILYSLEIYPQCVEMQFTDFFMVCVILCVYAYTRDRYGDYKLGCGCSWKFI